MKKVTKKVQAKGRLAMNRFDTDHRITLSSQGASGVDVENRTITGFRVLELGLVDNGIYRFEVDAKSLKMLAKLGKEQKAGVKVQFDHSYGPYAMEFGKLLGRAKNFRVQGDVLLADMKILKSADLSPNGNLGEYTLALAEEDPSSFGASISANAKLEYRLSSDGSMKKGDDGEPMLPLFRPVSLFSVDLVGEPAGTTALLSKAGQGIRTQLTSKGARVTMAKKNDGGDEGEMITMSKADLEELVSSSVGNAVAKANEASDLKRAGALKAERERQQKIRLAAGKLGIPADKVEEAIASEKDIETVQAEFIDLAATAGRIKLAGLGKDPGSSVSFSSPGGGGSSITQEEIDADLANVLLGKPLPVERAKAIWEASEKIRAEWKGSTQEVFLAWATSGASAKKASQN